MAPCKIYNSRQSWILYSTLWILDSRYWIFCQWNLDSRIRSFGLQTPKAKFPGFWKNPNNLVNLETYVKHFKKGIRIITLAEILTDLACFFCL